MQGTFATGNTNNAVGSKFASVFPPYLMVGIDRREAMQCDLVEHLENNVHSLECNVKAQNRRQETYITK